MVTSAKLKANWRMLQVPSYSGPDLVLSPSIEFRASWNFKHQRAGNDSVKVAPVRKTTVECLEPLSRACSPEATLGKSERTERPNYALERSVKGLAAGNAGAPEIIAPASPSQGLVRPAQRGR